MKKRSKKWKKKPSFEQVKVELISPLKRVRLNLYNFIFIGEFQPKEKKLNLNEGDSSCLLPHYINYFSKSPLDYID